MIGIERIASRRLAWTCAVLVLGALCGAAVVYGASQRGQDDSRARLAEDAARFRDLRRELQESSWRDRPDLGTWSGPMHDLMADLGERIARGRYRSRDVVRLLGAPDETVEAGGRHVQIAVPRGERHLVYWWRGGHDYLYFVIRGGRVAEAKWWFAGE